MEQWLADAHFSPLSGIPDADIRHKMEATINLMDNTTRGLLGEVLVAHALGGDITAPWDPWDVALPNGTKIEVKTAGLIQAWPQLRLAAPTWSIAPASAWQVLGAGYVWDPQQIRRSDWYLFALHSGVNPGNTEEWTFRPVPTHQIDSVAQVQKSIRMTSLDRLFDPPVLSYSDLRAWAEETGLLGFM